MFVLFHPKVSLHFCVGVVHGVLLDSLPKSCSLIISAESFLFCKTTLERDRRSPPKRVHKWRFIKCGRYCRTTTRVLIISLAVEVGMKLFLLERRWLLKVDRYIFSKNWHRTCKGGCSTFAPAAAGSDPEETKCTSGLWTRRKVACWSSRLLLKVWYNDLESAFSSSLLKLSRYSRRRRTLSLSGRGQGLRLGCWRLIFSAL